MTDNKYSYSNRKYEVVPYNPKWVRQFEELKVKIQTIFHNVQIEHIGSTSVPLMLGKPCIDVLVIVEDLREVETHVTDMEALGFEYAGKLVTEHSLLFRVMKDNALLANIHFFPVNHPHNKEMLDLRNYLRSHPEEVKAYSARKHELYTKYNNDYASYRKYKDEYMNALQERVADTSF